jgi:hypothetical protein
VYGLVIQALTVLHCFGCTVLRQPLKDGACRAFWSTFLNQVDIRSPAFRFLGQIRWEPAGYREVNERISEECRTESRAHSKRAKGMQVAGCVWTGAQFDASTRFSGAASKSSTADEWLFLHRGPPPSSTLSRWADWRFPTGGSGCGQREFAGSFHRLFLDHAHDCNATDNDARAGFAKRANTKSRLV